MLKASKVSIDNQVYVVGIVVTYFPDEEELCKCILSIADEIDLLILVDNTPNKGSIKLPIDLNLKVEVYCLEENKGIAAAQNIGILRATELNATHVLLLDQDSIFEQGGVKKLIHVMENRTRSGQRIAACCPLPFDATHVDGFPLITDKEGWPCRIGPKRFQSEMSVLHSISSGSLFAIDVFKYIGLMNEGLFIDYVDIEWCLRAKHFGFSIFVINDARIKHSLGNALRRISFLGVSRYFISYPVERYYYQIRNFIVIARLKHVPWRWVLCFAPSAIIAKPLLAISSSNKKLNTLLILVKGFYHGMVKKLGKYS
jgi:rhamnosyltransferase